MLLRLLTTAVTALLLAIGGAAPAQASSALPTRAGWVADVQGAMAGSRIYLRAHADDTRRTAVNLDIDNTALSSHYAYGRATPYVFRFSRLAREKGVALLFNTGRYQKDTGPAVRLLQKAGYPVTEICGRHVGETLAQGKQRCRRHFVDEGYRIIANIGNRSTDFTGPRNYGRAFVLPNYGNKLA